MATPIFDEVLTEQGPPLGEKTPTHDEFMKIHGQHEFLMKAELILAGNYHTMTIDIPEEKKPVTSRRRPAVKKETQS